jgi:hypothetical protein
MNNLIRTLAILSALLLAAGCSKRVEENSDRTAAAGSEGQAGTAPKTEPTGTTTGALSGQEDEATRAAIESCVDGWLKNQKLDPYGNPEGTMYAGGTPLFNESTGEMTDRLRYVFERKPEARQACINAAKK